MFFSCISIKLQEVKKLSAAGEPSHKGSLI